MKRIGVLLAAGESRRMGRPKQLLPWPPRAEHAKPMVAVAYDSIARVCDAMFVVLGHDADAVRAALGDRKYRYYTFSQSGDMFRSVRIGLSVGVLDCTAAEPQQFQALLQPADHPQVRLDTLQILIAAAETSPDMAIMPQYRGRGGHPALISKGIAKLICGHEGPGGLRQFWVDHPELCQRLPVDDPGVVFDVDTQADYDFYGG